MLRSHVLRALRLPVIILAVLAMAWLGLAMTEHSGTRMPTPLKVTPVSDGSGTDFGNSGGQPQKHCTDGHGQDDSHNKHCRGISHD